MLKASPITYIKHIDGLRAIAVISVICFHADIAGFSGGYVGVDIFFVISGYLITALILQQFKAGEFLLSAFWERRARRILPALFFVLFSSVPVAWVFLLPYDMQKFSGGLITIPLFVQNFFFWRNNTYFEPSTEFSPLVHTWSLAVEEQYYLLFPFFLLFLRRFQRENVFWILLCIVIIQFFLLQFVFADKLSFKFFMLPTRSWEILIGALVACRQTNTDKIEDLSPWIGELLSMTGLLLIIYSVIALDKNTVFPGWATLMPTLGTALILSCVSARTLISKMLGCKPLVAVGLVSYGAYLWHQPLLAFSRHIFVTAPSQWVTVCLGVCSLLLGWVSYQFVEKPFRQAERISRKTLVTVILCCSASLIVLGCAGLATHGFENRFSPEQKEVWAYTQYDVNKLWKVGTCFLQPEQSYREFGPACSADENASIPLTMVWGDSNAAALYPGLNQRFRRVAEYSASGCPPLLSVEQQWRPHCKSINDDVLERVKKLRPKRLVLFANWILYSEVNVPQELSATLDVLNKALPDTLIDVIGGVPQWYPSLPVYSKPPVNTVLQ
jgi:peptidoglycan/LPS O-acetylase OafA/YrhL